MIDLNWGGPFATGESSEYPNYRDVDKGPGFDGLYCWCVCVDGVFLPTYIGKSKGNTAGVIKRVSVEIREALKGLYMSLLDVDEFKAGRRLVIQPRFTPDASEKSGEHDDFHALHLDEYKAIVDASVLFFARKPEQSDATIIQVKQSTIARVQNSGLDAVPSIKPERGHYEFLLVNEPSNKESVEIIHHCAHLIRGLTKTSQSAGE